MNPWKFQMISETVYKHDNMCFKWNILKTHQNKGGNNNNNDNDNDNNNNNNNNNKDKVVSNKHKTEETPS